MILAGSMLNAQVYSNGNLSTGSTSSGGTAAPAGYTWSEVQSPNTTLGASAYISSAADFRLADDFVVPSTERWDISSVDVFAYQTSSTTMPFDALTLQILSGPPPSGAVVFGNTTTNIINRSATADSKIYRTGSTVNTTRKIWKVNGNVITTLNPGTYWLNFQVHATNDGAAFFPPVTNVGVVSPPGANAMQMSSTGWAPLMDTGSSTAQAMPFIITYVATSLGTTETRQLDSRVVVYPNPTQSTFRLSLPAESLGAKTEVGVFDSAGKKVKSFKLAESYDVSDLTKGMYIIKINDGQNIKATKLIKN